MNKRSIFVASVLAFALAGTALAAEFVAPKQGEDPNVTISASETRHNLYTVGSNANINGKISGDLFVAGGMVLVIGDVEEDLNAGGGTVSLSGKIGGDARVAGGNLSITSAIGGDLIIAGGNINITEKASIGGDLIIAGGNVTIDSSVAGNIKAVGGNFVINNKVGGNINIRVSGNKKNEGMLTFGSKAEVLGKIFHTGAKSAVIKEGAKVPEISFTLKQNMNRGALMGFLTIAFLIKLVAIFLACLVLVKYLQIGLRKIADHTMGKPWESLGLGLVGLFVTPIVAGLLLFSMVGFYIAGILFFWYVLLLMFAYLVGAIVFGAWLLKVFKVRQEFILDWKTAITGVLGLFVLGMIPFLGWAVCFAVFLIALGGLLKATKEKWAQGNNI